MKGKTAMEITSDIHGSNFFTPRPAADHDLDGTDALRQLEEASK